MYVAVKGGEQAILNSYRQLEHSGAAIARTRNLVSSKFPSSSSSPLIAS